MQLDNWMRKGRPIESAVLGRAQRGAKKYFAKRNSSAQGFTEKGTALAGVIAVFAVTIIIATVAAMATVNAVGFTSATRAGVQSLASANGGINFVLASLTNKKPCQMQYTQADVTDGGAGRENLHFTTVVYSGSKVTGPWTRGCPMSSTDHFVRLISTGTPEANGVTQARGDLRTVEAIYNWSPAYSTTVIKPSGPAIYSFSGGLFSGSSQLLNPEGLDSVVAIGHGNAGCTYETEGQSAIYNANVVVADGNWTTSGSCQIYGNVWVNGDLKTDRSSITFGSTWSKSLDMSYSSSIRGNAWVGGTTNMIESTTLTGNLTTAYKTGSQVPGSTTLEPSLDGQSPKFPNGLKPVQPWQDYPFKKTQWPAFAYTAMAPPCNPSTMQGAINRMAIDSPGPGILDLRGCSPIDEIEWRAAIVLPNDVAILTPTKFAVRGGGPAKSVDGTPHKLWLIQEDLIPNAQPDCPTGGYLTIGDDFVVNSDVTTMVYSPCLVTIGQSATWRGQVYAGGVTVAQSAILTYVPGGLPGVDLSDGSSSATDGGTTYSSKMGDRVSIRDLDAKD